MLATLGHPLSDDEIATYVLTRLDNDYDPSVTSLTTGVELVSLNEVYAHFMAFEMLTQLGITWKPWWAWQKLQWPMQPGNVIKQQRAWTLPA